MTTKRPDGPQPSNEGIGGATNPDESGSGASRSGPASVGPASVGPESADPRRSPLSDPQRTGAPPRDRGFDAPVSLTATAELGDVLRADHATLSRARRRELVSSALDAAWPDGIDASDTDTSPSNMASSRRSANAQRWLPLMAAACFVLIVAAGIWAISHRMGTGTDDASVASSDAADIADSSTQTVTASLDGTDESAGDAFSAANSDPLLESGSAQYNRAEASAASDDEAVAAEDADRDSFGTSGAAAITGPPPVVVAELSLQDFDEVMNGARPSDLASAVTPPAPQAADAPATVPPVGGEQGSEVEDDATMPEVPRADAPASLMILPAASPSLIAAATAYAQDGDVCGQTGVVRLSGVYEVAGAIVRVYENVDSGTLAVFDEDCRPVE